MWKWGQQTMCLNMEAKIRTWNWSLIPLNAEKMLVLSESLGVWSVNFISYGLKEFRYLLPPHEQMRAWVNGWRIKQANRVLYLSSSQHRGYGLVASKSLDSLSQGYMSQFQNSRDRYLVVAKQFWLHIPISNGPLCLYIHIIANIGG